MNNENPIAPAPQPEHQQTLGNQPQNQAPLPPQKPVSMAKVWWGLGGFVALIAFLIWAIIALTGLTSASQRADILKNGVSTPAVSTGGVYEGKETVGRARSGSFKTVYNARYTYEVDGRSYSTTGQKDYGSREAIKEGMRATVVYMEDDPNETAVKDEE